MAPFQKIFPAVTHVLGDFSFSLSNGGEIVSHLDAGVALVDSVEYEVEAPWPTEPDGDGPTLELINPNLDNSLAASWKASIVAVAPHGTPGAENSNFSTGVDDLLKDQVSVLIYPNPIKDKAIIRIKSKLNFNKYSFQLYNMLGQKVQSIDFKTNELLINSDKLESGFYICKIFADNKLIDSSKLIIKK
jgi:hypothetical protein